MHAIEQPQRGKSYRYNAPPGAITDGDILRMGIS